MPKYRIELSDGRKFEVEADAPPSEQDVLAMLAKQTPSPAPSAPAAPAEKSLTGFLPNLASSAGNFATDTWEGAKLLANPYGTLLRALPKDAADAQQKRAALMQLPSAMIQALKDRYGSLEAAGNTLYTDPVGVAGDVSTVFGGLSAASKVGGVPRVARLLNTASHVTNPLTAVTAPIAKTARVIGPGLERAGVSAYERMLKPNKSTIEGMPAFGPTLEARSGTVARALIEDPHGQISKRGAERFADTTSGMQGQVDALVDASPEARGSTQHLTDALAGGRGRFATQWAPAGDVSAYNSVAGEVVNNPRITKTKRGVIDRSIEHAQGLAPAPSEVAVVGREMIPRIRAGSARELTQGTYRTLGDKAYGELKGASTEAHKAAARGGRAILNEAIPAAEPLNNAIARRIDLGQILDEAVFRSGKHDPVGLGQQVVLSGNPGLLWASLINRPGVGSPVARGVFQTGQAFGKARVNPGTMRAALLARMLAGDEQEPPEQ